MLDTVLKPLRDNPRLRWGVAAIVGIFWLYAILLLQEALQDESQQYRAAAQNITRLRASLAQPEWVARATAAQALAVQLEARLWQAPTSGLAQAAFQDWIKTALAKAAVTNPQVTVTVIDEAAAPGQKQDAGGGRLVDHRDGDLRVGDGGFGQRGFDPVLEGGLREARGRGLP